jgi:hypothetical protein
MKTLLKSLALCTLVTLMASCSSNTDSGGSTQSTDRFTFRVGDYAVYQNSQLDSLNRPVTSGALANYRSTRTVVRGGVSLGGQNDGFLIVDSSFFPTSGLPAGVAGGTRVDTTYYRVANDEVFVWFDPSRANSSVSGISTGGGAAPRITGLTSQWYKVAELRDAAGSDYSTNLSFNVVDMTLGTIPFTVILSGRNTGRASLSLNGTSNAVHRQSTRVRASFMVPLLGSINLEVPGEIDYGIPSAGAQRAILRTQTNSYTLTLPLIGSQSVPGSLGTLVSFRPGA